ncbi:M48 family metalloprotease [Reyranella sp.]|uniref:M48 family metalloprotease n=1 Tax=Reyranella sp. TaxID=1929291 RepID=UPI003D0D906E
MVFRSLVALLLLAALACGCTPGSISPQTAGPVAQGGDTLPSEVEKAVGPAYRSPELQAFVNRVGQRLVSQASVPGSYRFFVLDQPVANAHALSNGYVFVTRGLLALMDDEAELAAAMAHELGHLTERHAAQRERERRVVMDAAVEAAMKTGSITVGRSVARDGLIRLRRYSRDQELEADRVGVGYITRAGYRGDAMITLIEKLRRQSALEDQIYGQPEDSREPSALSTHPAADDRLVALRGAAGVGPTGESGRAGYLAVIDGMSVDDPPEEGFVRGPTFQHPTMRIAFSAPRDFRLYNDHEGVLGVGSDRSLLYFTCKAGSVPGRLDDWMRNKLQPTPTDIQSTEIGGAEAAIGARPRGSDTGLSQVRYVIIRRPDGICYFNLLSDGADRDRRIAAMVEATRSFRDLTPAEAAALRPYRLRVVPRSGGSAAAYAARMPYPDLKLERLLALNGVDDAAGFARRDQVKIVEP